MWVLSITQQETTSIKAHTLSTRLTHLSQHNNTETMDSNMSSFITYQPMWMPMSPEQCQAVSGFQLMDFSKAEPTEDEVDVALESFEKELENDEVHRAFEEFEKEIAETIASKKIVNIENTIVKPSKKSWADISEEDEKKDEKTLEKKDEKTLEKKNEKKAIKQVTPWKEVPKERPVVEIIHTTSKTTAEPNVLANVKSAKGDVWGAKALPTERKVVQISSQYKTELCKYWKQGKCNKKAKDCGYAHGLEDLVNRKGKFTRMCINADNCEYGHACHFAHNKKELVQNTRSMCPEDECDDEECVFAHSIWEQKGECQVQLNDNFCTMMCKYGKICNNCECQYAHHKADLYEL
jgi:hypothetical protein